MVKDLLTEIADPELPFLNIVELGIVRDALLEGDRLRVTITPTYSGCPATYTIRETIVSVLHEKGFPNVDVQTSFSPAWTTDWLSKETKQKLKAAGIAPPGTTQCPYCNSADTELRSGFRFSSTFNARPDTEMRSGFRFFRITPGPGEP